MAIAFYYSVSVPKRRIGKSKQIIELMSMHEREVLRDEELMAKVDKLLFLQKSAISMESQSQRQIDSLLPKRPSFEEPLKISNKECYGSKSQKGIRKKVQPETNDHIRDKDDFDGTPGSISSSTSCDESGDMAVKDKEREFCLYRQGLACLIVR